MGARPGRRPLLPPPTPVAASPPGRDGQPGPSGSGARGHRTQGLVDAPSASASPAEGHTGRQERQRSGRPRTHPGPGTRTGQGREGEGSTAAREGLPPLVGPTAREGLPPLGGPTAREGVPAHVARASEETRQGRVPGRARVEPSGAFASPPAVTRLASGRRHAARRQRRLAGFTSDLCWPWDPGQRPGAREPQRARPRHTVAGLAPASRSTVWTHSAMSQARHGGATAGGPHAQGPGSHERASWCEITQPDGTA